MATATRVGAILAILVLAAGCTVPEDETVAKNGTKPASAASQQDDTEAPTEDSTPDSEPDLVDVPELERTSIDDARTQLEEADLTVEIDERPSWKPVGTVLEQQVEAGTGVSPGTVVTLVVAAAMPKVPRTVGLAGKEAITQLRKAGFRVNLTRKTVTSGTTGTVLSQSPAGAERAKPGSAVGLVLANVVRPVAAASTGNCTPGYSPCLPPASDYDCEDGGGNGPKYTGFVRVTGSDPYGLDTDGDGAACEAS